MENACYYRFGIQGHTGTRQLSGAIYTPQPLKIA